MDDILFSKTLVALFKGVVSENKQTKEWSVIISNQVKIEDYIMKLGLTLVIQKQDGYAYLKQRVYEDDEIEIPRLIAKRPLGFSTSLILVLLRKEFAEMNKIGVNERFVLSENDIIEKVKPYMKETNDEVKQRKDIIRCIKQVEDMGFLIRLKETDQFEIVSLIRGFVDAQWLEDFDEKLLEYKNYYTIEASDEVDKNGSI